MGEHDQRLAGLRGESTRPVRKEPSPEDGAPPLPTSNDNTASPEEPPDVPSPQRRLDALRASGPRRER